jgi:ribosomal-protein-alanine N-acetyltransferase
MGLPLRTDRLLIRPLSPGDLEPFHEVFGDPEVMSRIPSGVSRDVEHSAERLAWLIDHHDKHGFSLWAVEELETGEMIGDCGLVLVEGKGTEVELAYHLARSRWGRGYGGEAAAAVVDYGLGELGLDEIIAIAEQDHFVSRRVMEKVGMLFDGKGIYYGQEMARYVIRGSGEVA